MKKVLAIGLLLLLVTGINYSALSQTETTYPTLTASPTATATASPTATATASPTATATASPTPTPYLDPTIDSTTVPGGCETGEDCTTAAAMPCDACEYRSTTGTNGMANGCTRTKVVNMVTYTEYDCSYMGAFNWVYECCFQIRSTTCSANYPNCPCGDMSRGGIDRLRYCYR